MRFQVFLLVVIALKELAVTANSILKRVSNIFVRPDANSNKNVIIIASAKMNGPVILGLNHWRRCLCA